MLTRFRRCSPHLTTCTRPCGVRGHQLPGPIGAILPGPGPAACRRAARGTSPWLTPWRRFWKRVRSRGPMVLPGLQGTLDRPQGTGVAEHRTTPSPRVISVCLKVLQALGLRLNSIPSLCLPLPPLVTPTCVCFPKDSPQGLHSSEWSLMMKRGLPLNRSQPGTLPFPPPSTQFASEVGFRVRRYSPGSFLRAESKTHSGFVEKMQCGVIAGK